jgi:hypothetical protein
LFYDLYGFRRSSSGANGLNVWKFIKKWPFFSFSKKKIHFFLITAQIFSFFPVHDSYSNQKNSTCIIRYRGQSIINVQIYFDQLFRGHKKQFSDQFLELDNKWMIEIGSKTCDTHISMVSWLKLSRKPLKICDCLTDFVVFIWLL